MKINREARQAAKGLFRACAAPDGAIDEARLSHTVKLLAERKPRNFLAILVHLRKLVALSIEQRRAVIESAAPLNAEQQQELLGSLRARHGVRDAEFSVNPGLLGGVRVRVGSDVWDGSIQGRLRELAASL
jgi:F-type H+-transporting ATPase subunit delta